MSIQTLKEDHKYLVLGINNSLKLYTFIAKSSGDFKVEFMQSKEYGTLINDIKVVQNTIAIGDLQKAIMIYEFKESRSQNNKCLTESAHANETMWVNKILALNPYQFMAFDIDRNVFIYERAQLPTNDKEKYKLNLIGCMRIGEIVNCAIFGSLN